MATMKPAKGLKPGDRVTVTDPANQEVYTGTLESRYDELSVSALGPDHLALKEAHLQLNIVTDDGERRIVKVHEDTPVDQS